LVGHHVDQLTIDQLTNETRKRSGGDARTPLARLESARREQQIVALRLRGVSFFEMGRVLGIPRQSAHHAFNKALRRNTDRTFRLIIGANSPSWTHSRPGYRTID